MQFLEGQGILGKIQFIDGSMPEYDRTYLIVSVNTDSIEVLNVSSIRGKERKLLFPFNERLRLYNPPFWKPSFVKLDSLMQVSLSECSDFFLLSGGARLDMTELQRIKKLLKS